MGKKHREALSILGQVTVWSIGIARLPGLKLPITQTGKLQDDSNDKVISWYLQMHRRSKLGYEQLSYRSLGRPWKVMKQTQQTKVSSIKNPNALMPISSF